MPVEPRCADLRTTRPRITAARSAPARLIAHLGVVLSALLLALAPSAALAHDHLLSSDPADGAVLNASPSTITLTFSDAPLDVSPVIKVTASDGGVAVEGAPRIQESSAVIDVPPLPNGTTTVQWRVVSSDGHPIEGTFTFVVEAESATTPTDSATTPTDSATPAETPTESATTPPAASTTATAEEGGGLSGGAIAALLLPVVVIVGIAAALLLRRRRR